MPLYSTLLPVDAAAAYVIDLLCRAYVSSTGDAAEESSMAPTGDGLTSFGNTDTHAEAGAAGTDITASSGYGSRKAPDEQPGQVRDLCHKLICGVVVPLELLCCSIKSCAHSCMMAASAVLIMHAGDPSKRLGGRVLQHSKAGLPMSDLTAQPGLW